MQISLPPNLEAFVSAKVRSNEYANASDVVCAAVRLMQQQDRIYRRKLDRLRAEVAKGDAALAAGRITSLTTDEEVEAFFAQL